MLKLGLTGGVGSGKSAAARIFQARGAKILNSDQVAHDTMRPGTAVWKKVVQAFGNEILLKSREIDRKKLSKIVFSQPEKLRQLESLVHPAVVKIIRSWFAQCQCRKRGKNSVAVVEVPLLFEAKLERLFDRVVAVTAPRRLQLKRASGRGLSRRELLLRMRSQMSQREKARRADYVVANSGTKKELEKKIGMLWRHLTHPNKKRKR